MMVVVLMMMVDMASSMMLSRNRSLIQIGVALSYPLTFFLPRAGTGESARCGAGTLTEAFWRGHISF